MTTNGSLVNLFKTRLSLFNGLLMLKELVGIFKISEGNFVRNGCHVGLVGGNPTWIRERLHTG